nr:uncharacterized protein LOC123758831 [Procambarus clarkii]
MEGIASITSLPSQRDLAGKELLGQPRGAANPLPAPAHIKGCLRPLLKDGSFKEGNFGDGSDQVSGHDQPGSHHRAPGDASVTSKTGVAAAQNTAHKKISEYASRAVSGSPEAWKKYISGLVNEEIPSSNGDKDELQCPNTCQSVTGNVKYEQDDLNITDEDDSERPINSEKDDRDIGVGNVEVESGVRNIEERVGINEDSDNTLVDVSSRSDGNLGGSVGMCVQNIAVGVESIPGSAGHIRGSIENILGSLGNIGGSLGNILGSFGNIGGSDRNIGGSVGNIAETFGNIGGSVENIVGSLRNIGESDRNIGGSVENIVGSLRNIGESDRNIGGSVGNIVGSLRNIGESDRNIGGSVENIVGSLRNIGESDRNIGGSVGNIGGSVGNIVGSVGNIGGSVGNIGGSVGNIVGSVGNIGGSVGNIVGSVGNIGGSVGNIGGSVGNIGGSVGNIGGSVGNIGGSVGNIRGSVDKVSRSVKHIGGSDGNIGGSGWRFGGSLRKFGSSLRRFGSDSKIKCSGKTRNTELKLTASNGKTRNSSGKINSVTEDEENGGCCGFPARGRDVAGGSRARGGDVAGGSRARSGDVAGGSRAKGGDAPSRGGKRNKSEGSEPEETKADRLHKKMSSGGNKVGRAFSFSPASRSKPSPASVPAVNRIFGRFSFRKSSSIFSTFSQFLASYIFKPSLRKSSDPSPLRTEDNIDKNEEEKGREEIQRCAEQRDGAVVTAEACLDAETQRNVERGSESEGGAGQVHAGEEVKCCSVGRADGNELSHNNNETSKPDRDNTMHLCLFGDNDSNDDVFRASDVKGGEDKVGELAREDENSSTQSAVENYEEYVIGTGWVKKRVSQIERQISVKKMEEQQKLVRQKSTTTTLSYRSGDGKTSTSSDDTATLTEDQDEGRRSADEEVENNKPHGEDENKSGESDDSDTEVEDDEMGDVVLLRSKSRGQVASLYRYSDCPTSLYRYSAIRPRTVIIGLGVCTETQFFRGSFGDGVSETESEDEEEDAAPITGLTTPSTPRPQSRPPSPSRTSRPHSPLSDMDTESKRNSQAVSTEPSDLEDHSSLTTSDLDSCHDLAALDARKDKAYRIAHELLHTERTYVKVLHLIDQEFQFRVDHENRAHHMFPHDVIPHMFSNVKSIYKLHHDFLLPQLEERMAQWEQNRRIGDIMKSFAPFLKMYTEYVRNFDNAMTLINQWQAKCPRFAAIMDEIHSMEVCGNLTLQHHMLSPVQRIPRYEMLLKDYLKKLPEDSPDRHDTEKALHLVSTAANHANDAMKKIDKFEKLLEIQESLGGAEDLVSPTRELIKEGKIIKISARSGDHQERYIFLLTDLLLLCSPRLMGGRVMSGPQYRLRAKYHVENLIVQEGDNLETANTFYIKDNNKSVELYTQTLEEKEQWLEAFIRAIHETSQRKSSLKLHFNPDQRIVDLDLGQKQPMLIRSDSVNKCMECGSQFTMVRRKHHCRACGAVVCSKCSSFKASLAYESGKSVRVCRTCYATLQELSSSTATPSPEIDDADECSLYSTKEPLDLPFRNRGVLEVSAKTGGAVIQGFLQLKTHRKTWVKRWFALHTDFVLYSFKCEADDQALTATPVPGFTVTHLQGTRNESGISEKEKERAFKLHHSKKHYIFQAASKEESQRWVAALKKASQAELPSPVQ